VSDVIANGTKLDYEQAPEEPIYFWNHLEDEPELSSSAHYEGKA
jgi:hypothetical protein